MPVYEYRCADCTTIFEKLVPMSANGAPSTCPTCGGRAEKLLSTFAALGVERPSAGGGGGGCCGGGGGGCACAG
jgi:putative FmdB family regulatory protein